MANFLPAYRATNARESLALSNVTTDRGGLTYGGIARKRKPGASWEGWEVIDRILARGNGFAPSAGEQTLIQQLHEKFFRTHFWDELNCGLIVSQEIADKAYDAGVNCGPGNAARWLQTALNAANRRAKLWPDIAIDGQIGEATRDAIAQALQHRHRLWLVMQLLETQQEHHYFTLALSDPSQEDNLLGWYTHRITARSAPSP
jgi:lysozyme family protein